MKTLLALVLSLAVWSALPAAALDNLDTVYLKRTNGRINRLYFSPDDKYILAVNDPNGAAVFTASNGEYAATFQGVSAAQWSSDGRWFVAWIAYGSTNTVVRYETETWRAMDTITLPVGEPVNNDYYMSLAPDNRTLAVSWIIPRLKSFLFYDLSEHRLVRETVYFDPGLTLPLPPTVEAQEMVYTPDGRYIIFHASDWQIRFFDVAADSVVFVYQYGGGGRLLAMSGDGSKIAFSTHKKDIAVQIMDVATRKIVGEIPEKVYQLTGIALSPDGSLIAVAFGFNSTYINVQKTSDMSVVAQATNSSFSSPAFSTKGKYLSAVSGKHLWLFALPPVVSVHDPATQVDESVYPNPVIDKLTINFTSIVLGEIIVVIYINNGTEVRRFAIEANRYGADSLSIIVSDLQRGAYRAVLQVGGVTIKNVSFVKL